MKPVGLLLPLAIFVSPFLTALSHAADEPVFSREQIEFFEKQVRPILAAHCWNCHAGKKAESGLRLDSREAILKGGDRGEVVTPPEATASLLIHAIRREGDLQMPPNGRLTAGQIAALTKWIEIGLPWPREASGSAITQAWRSHWAFQPVTKPNVPASTHDVWSQSPIDRFVLQNLDLRGRGASGDPRFPFGEDARKHFSMRADRRTLIRRATFDLIGLPPTPDEVAEFEADPAPDACERLVDRLLASPHYGERWGRHWLDVARYSDTKGYVFFEERTYPWAYTYRDYVIRSLNEDKPYDQFVLEQLAADLLGEDGDTDRDEAKERGQETASRSRAEQLPALGFLTVGSHFMGNVHDILDDRIDVVTRGLMGLTVTCARCHDHKYDPIPAADYYSLYGVFRSTTEPLVLPLFAPPRDTPEYRRFTIELTLRQQQLDDFVRQKHTGLVEGSRTRVGEYLLAAKAADDKPAIDDFMLIADPGDLNPAMIVRWQAYLGKLEGRNGTSASHPVWGPWLELAALPEERFQESAARVCHSLVEQLGSASRRVVNLAPAPQAGREGTGGANPLVVKAVCREMSPQSLNEVAARYGELMKSVHLKWQALLREAVILKRPAPERFDDPDEEELRIELYGAAAPANVPLIFGWGFLSLLPDRASQGEYQKVLKHLEQWLIHGPGAPPRAMVLHDSEPFDPRIFVRGNPNRLGDAVPRQFLSAIERDHRTPFTTGSGRLELAKAIIDPGNPLTSRVMVNRVWQHLFGSGLVRSPGDFGMRSDPPTHPELLDWLANEFGMRDKLDGSSVAAALPGQPSAIPNSQFKWSLKRLHRLILSSRVYQQSSRPPSGSDADPENRSLRHANRRRLDFEATRDALLFVTGRLDDRLGGPSQPMLEGGFQPRRTLYAFLDRLDPPGLLSVFDFPSPAATSAARDTTTVSPQALYLMNGPLTATVAELVTLRPDVIRETETAARVRRISQILFAREPRPAEAQLAADFLGSQPTPALWQQFVQAQLLTNEFLFVD